MSDSPKSDSPGRDSPKSDSSGRDSPARDSPRNDSDPAALVAQDLRAKLRRMSAEDLVELTAQLMTTYVIEGVMPLARAGESSELPADTVGDESFAQMLKRLKASKKDPVLERFFIDGENISVRIDGQGIMPVTEYRRPVGPPAAAGQGPAPQSRRESVPGAAASIYNRSLYQPDQQAPRQGAPQQPPAQQQRAAPVPPQTGQQAQPGQPAPQPGQKKEEPKSDRFSLIELE